MTAPVAFAFADPARRTWLAVSKDASYYHVVTPTPDDAQLITDGLRHKGQLSCTCAGGRYRGTCYVVVSCEAIESAAAAPSPYVHDFGECQGPCVYCAAEQAESAGDAPPASEGNWFDAPAGAGEDVEAFRG